MRGSRAQNGGRGSVRHVGKATIGHNAPLSWLVCAFAMPRRHIVKCTRLVLRHYKGIDRQFTTKALVNHKASAQGFAFGPDRQARPGARVRHFTGDAYSFGAFSSLRGRPLLPHSKCLGPHFLRRVPGRPDSTPFAPSFASRPIFWTAWRTTEKVVSEKPTLIEKPLKHSSQELTREETQRRLRASPLYGMYRYSELGAGKEKRTGIASPKQQKAQSKMTDKDALLAFAKLGKQQPIRKYTHASRSPCSKLSPTSRHAIVAYAGLAEKK
eukprot:jgi/Botrbrau1/7819/Bobra.0159s0247.1